MSIFLVGGATTPEVDAELWPAFVAEASAYAARSERTVPRIAVVIVDEGDGEAALDTIARQLGGDCEVRPVLVPIGHDVQQADLAMIDALYIAGGLTPAYRQAVHPVQGEIRRLVAGGLPYLGYSAGAQIAAEQAIVGGWRIGGVPVAPSDAAEDLDEVTIEQGIGLVDISVDVHAAQWGTVGRLIAAVEAGMVPGGVAIDESTALVVGDGDLRVLGTGSVWQVVPSESGVNVSTAGA